MILKLCNEDVYDIDNDIIINKDLAPGLLLKSGYSSWVRTRYSSNTNTCSRNLRALTYKQGNREKINIGTHALSLSDSYWITDDKNLKFEDVSPYYNKFWNGDGVYSGGAIPTLYVDGFLPKEWISKDIFIKYHKNAKIEYLATKLCEACNISCCITEYNDNEANIIKIHNITSPTVMFESAIQSGIFDPDDFTDEQILDTFGEDGLKMLVIDAITGNGDRHAGNFGFLRSTTTGEYLGMAPLFDFYHALDAKGSNDILIQSIVDLDTMYYDSILYICKIASSTNFHESFSYRAKVIMERIENKR